MRRMGVAAFYRVVRDVLPDKFPVDGCKGITGVYHNHFFALKGLFTREKSEHGVFQVTVCFENYGTAKGPNCIPVQQKRGTVVENEVREAATGEFR